MSYPAQQWHQEHSQQHPVGKKPKITRLGIIVTAVVLLGIGTVIFFVSRSSPGVGDCAEAKSQSRNRIELVKADCASPKAMYKLVDSTRSRTPTCPDGDYLSETSSRSRKTSKKTRECYMLNVKEGDCLTRVAHSSETTLFERVPCGMSPHKVTKVVAGKADAKACAPGDDPKVYSQPATTVCISKV